MATACRCPKGAQRFSTNPKNKSGRPRGPGFVCMKRDENAPRFVKPTKTGDCPKGSRKRSNGRGGSVCIGTVKSLRKAGNRNVKPGYRIVSMECPGEQRSKKRTKKRATKRQRS